MMIDGKIDISSRYEYTFQELVNLASGQDTHLFVTAVR